MPPDDFALPNDQYRLVWSAFHHLVKTLNSAQGLEVGQPYLQILADQNVNAQFDRTTNSVKIWLGLVELFADSPSGSQSQGPTRRSLARRPLKVVHCAN
jgi:hypothetical protein